MTAVDLNTAPDALNNDQQLPFSQLNTGAGTTILFIHGAFVDRGDWDLVTLHLPDYHILLPDLPGHGEANTIKPFSTPLAAKLLTTTIRRHANNGKAHVVGLSLGAYVALRLAVDYPDVVDELFISGIKVLPPMSRFAPHGLWLEQRIENALPRSFVRWLMDGTDIRPADLSRSTVALCKEVLDTITFADTDSIWPSPWPARTLIVAAGKAGIVPSSDHPADAVKLREIGRQLNCETVAYTHPQMRHPWNRQDPKLFADTARAWFEHDAMPEGFTELRVR
ncbi:hypothetical protein LTR36_008017 [Oleoguttula mirabilis]|uniref:AB hydrolase-1 domain-containing protein n=1 Tax=Oleoguttula mirabilis TaxID=1507867 RepID=A0AAV9J8V1_9PEZI|nr:hypothetical protein LTR36_008017 [Oleoguttula mirabilis]